MSLFFFYSLRIRLYQVLLLNRSFIWSIPYNKVHEYNLKKHIRIKSSCRISPQTEHIYVEVICSLIQRSEKGILIPFPLAYAKKIAENLILKIIKEEARQRLRETLVSDFSELEHRLLSYLEEDFLANQDLCAVLEAFKAKHPDQYQLVIWHHLENKNHRDISLILYKSSSGKPYDRTRQQVGRATKKFLKFGKKFFGWHP